MFSYLGRSWVGRHNAFWMQWNNYISKFNARDDGFYCPPKQLIGGNLQPPPKPSTPQPVTDLSYILRKNEELLQIKENVKTFTPEYEHQLDIQIFDYWDYLAYNIESDKYTAIKINYTTQDLFNEEYAIIHNNIQLDKY